MLCRSSTWRNLLTAAAALLFTTGCASAPFGDTSGISPFQEWKQIETEHFWITFSEPTTEVAQKTADYLEEAHRTLVPILLWEPHKKTHVTLLDSTDEANGSAAPQRTPGMILHLVPPNPHSSGNWMDSWLRGLCIHEYTHFLNMDPTRGIYTPARWIWGDALLPNAAWYPWMLEGYAVFFETRYHGGRGRSTYWDMILRAMVLEKTLNTPQGVTLDRLMVSNPYFPGGETWYLFGYSLTHAFWKHAQLVQSGDWGLGLLSKNSSYRVPYLIDGNAENVIGLGWSMLWSEWTTRAEDRAHAALDAIRKSPTTPLVWHTQPDHAESREIIAPLESPDGKYLAYAASSTRDWEALWLHELPLSANAPPARRIADTLDVAQLSWSPDSQWLAYASITRTQQYYQFYDLYVARARDGRILRLTEGERARDPDFSPDGKWLSYVRIPRTGYQELVRAELIESDGELRLGKRQVVVAAPLLDRLASARFGASADSIFYSQHTDGQYSEEIWEWTPAGPHVVLGGGAFHRFPFFARRGTYAGQLLYQSDATGVDQIYVQGHGRISNFETGARMVSPSSHGAELWVSGFSAQGWNLAQFVPLTAALPEKSDANSRVVQADAPPAATSDRITVAQTQATQDYSGFNSLYPRMWSPMAFYTPGYFSFGAAAYGNDALDFHRYAVSAAMDTLSFRPTWSLGYNNRSLGPSISLDLLDQAIGVLTSTAPIYFVRRVQLVLGASFPFRSTFSSLTPSIAFAAAQNQTYINGTSDPFGTQVDRGTYIPRLDVGATYRYTRGSTLSVAAETGRISQLYGRLALVSGTPVPKLYASHSEYFRLGESHVVIQPKVDTLWTPMNAALAGSERPRVSGFPLTYSGFTATNYWGSAVATESLYQLSVRGYPWILAASSWASTASLDVRFPIWNIYRGINTFPITFNRLHGRMFLESAIFPLGDFSPALLPAAGAALELEMTLFTQVPLSFAVQFQNGFITASGGDQLVLFGVNLGGL